MGKAGGWMIAAPLDEILATLTNADIPATDDARNITAPCCFVTVTNLRGFTLGGGYEAEGEILAIVPDHGGRADIEALSNLLEDIYSAIDVPHIEVRNIATNQQATPPTGGTLPAARIDFTIYK